MRKLIIDVGHGGYDRGASAFGYLEKDLNLIVAKRVKELLKDYNPDITRTTDKDVDRVDMIKSKYEYCLSIHFNAGGGSGIETIHSIYSENGKELALNIAESLKENTGLPVRRVFSRRGKNGDYYYMHRLTGSTTTVIVECLFLDSQSDIESLNIERIAKGISKGFEAYMSKFEKPKYSPAKYDYIGSTNIAEVDPMSLKIEVVKKAGTNISRDFVNGTFFGYHEGKFISIGTLVSEGRLIAKQLDHDPKRGHFLVYKDGSVSVEMIKDIEKEKDLSKIWFAISGFNMFPLDLKGEWFDPKEVSYQTWRTTLGYNPEKKKAVIAVRPSSTAERGKQTLVNLGCTIGIGLDSGGSTNARFNGKDIRLTTRTLHNVIRW